MAQHPQKGATGNRQSDYAGTNTDRYRDPQPENKQDNPIQDEEAQNVTDGNDRLSGSEAERSTNKAKESKEDEGA